MPQRDGASGAHKIQNKKGANLPACPLAFTILLIMRLHLTEPGWIPLTC